MKLLKWLKSLLGLGSEESGEDTTGRDEPTVTVEHEPDTETEEAVKGVETETEEEPISGEQAEEESTSGEQATLTEESTSGEPEIEESPDEETGEDDEESTPQVEDVQTIKGIGPAYADRLAEVDIETVEDLLESDIEVITEETGIATARVEGWIDRASE